MTTTTTTTDYLQKLGLALFRPLKRPIWLATRALTGRSLQLHTHFLDFSVYGGIFDARADAVRARLPSGFEPIESRPGRAPIHLLAFDYRAIDLLSPYREVLIAAPARYRPGEGSAHEGAFVLQLPVTTEEARWTGVHLYGFPKTLADIEIYAQNGGRTCTMHENGQHVLTLHVDRRPTEERSLSFTNFTVRDQREVVMSAFDLTGAIAVAERPGGVALELGYHAIADQLRALELDLDGRVVFGAKASAVLGPAIVLGALPQALARRGAAAATGRPPAGPFEPLPAA